MAGEETIITVNAAIAKLRAYSVIDKRGQDVLAAAMMLRGAKGRDRKNQLRLMTGTWGVERRVKAGGSLRERPIPAIARELESAICQAAAKWQPPSAGEGAEQHDVPEHGAASSGPHRTGHEPQILVLAKRKRTWCT